MIQGKMGMERVEVRQKGRGLERVERLEKVETKVIQREKDEEEMEIGRGKLVQVERLEKGQVKVIP